MIRVPASIGLLLVANVAHAATVISQVHNAPGWQPSHSYTFGNAPFTRVNNGPGWNPATGYSAGKPVNAYQLISPGNCVSGTSGGPVGAGDAITDGTCTWRYVSSVDYVSLTGWAFDNAPWAAGTYGGAGYVRVGTKIYSLASPSCNSTVAPTGTSPTVATSDGCQWNYWTDIIYSSNVSYIPTQTYTRGDVNTRTYHMTADHQANLWNDREYVAGENGERQIMGPQAHMDVTNDFDGGKSGGFPCAPCHRIIITAAPGESFADRLTPNDPFTGYDPAKGVALRKSTSGGFYGVNGNAGLQPRDNFVDIIGLQIKSDHGAAVDFQEVHSNNDTVQRSILEGAGIYFVLEFDAGPSVLANSLVISHGVSGGVWSKYPDLILHSTIVDLSGNPGTVGIGEFWQWVYDPIKIFDTAVFGFGDAIAHTPATDAFWDRTNSKHNATDLSATDTRATKNHGSGVMMQADPLPGAIYSIPKTAAFMAWGTDWRVPKSSPLFGAGAAFGRVEAFCQSGHSGANCPYSTTYNFDNQKVVGQVHSQAGVDNIGAW